MTGSVLVEKRPVAPAAQATLATAPVRVALDIGLSAGWNPKSKDKVGVTRAIDILRDDLLRTMALLGCPSLDKLDRSFIEVN